jgi:DUF2934 family protein
MKSDPPRKGRSSKSSQAKVSDPSGVPEKPNEASRPETGSSSAEGTTGHRVSEGTKPSRRDRDKQAKPPVRIVSDLPPEREVVPRGKQTRMSARADGQPASAGKVTPERIAQRAYELYQAGGCEPGREVEHWLEAERQLEAEQRGRREN